MLKLGEGQLECTVDLKIHFNYLSTGQVSVGYDGVSAVFTPDNMEPLLPVYNQIHKRVERAIRDQIEKTSQG
ncbi:hypothetical protein BE21_58410 [Sorangium cellulosum]|uniref:Uncharacterized protein n=1 Tax=Sorangium cellulosum TaxID=56 RepID=A0A150U243_SORCE|nr:hypothetical protein BE21_58410 [Sorangium cellulosum]